MLTSFFSHHIIKWIEYLESNRRKKTDRIKNTVQNPIANANANGKSCLLNWAWNGIIVFINAIHWSWNFSVIFFFLNSLSGCCCCLLIYDSFCFASQLALSRPLNQISICNCSLIHGTSIFLEHPFATCIRFKTKQPLSLLLFFPSFLSPLVQDQKQQFYLFIIYY